jgi:hypothetical protein
MNKFNGRSRTENSGRLLPEYGEPFNSRQHDNQLKEK